MADYYQTLGVGRDANTDAIRQAFRRLAKKYHPDKNPGDEAAEKKFKKINQAYEILKDQRKKAAYDQYGHAAFTQAGQGRPPPNAGGGFGDLFEEMLGGNPFGRKSRHSDRQRGRDLRYNITLSLEESFRGKKATLSFNALDRCSHCEGKGSDGADDHTVCPGCGGHGAVRHQQGFLTIEQTCSQCGGQGHIIKNLCKHCNGSGQSRRKRKLEVDIPPGIDNDNQIRLAGKGEAGGRGGPPGDMYIIATIRRHDLFERQGNNLYCQVPTVMIMATLGGTIEVPTIDGTRIKLTVPAGTQSGDHLRMRGKGMPVLNAGGRRGDAIMTMVVETPRALNAEQKELLQRFQDASSQKVNSPQSAGFFGKIKSFLDVK